MLSREDKTEILTALYIAALVLANTAGSKIMTFLGIRASVAIFLIPILFLVTDVIGEVYGARQARRLVLISIVINVFIFFMLHLFIEIKPFPYYEDQDSYETVFSASRRFILASVIAFSLSQIHDVWAFGFWKKKTNSRFLWLRNNLSTIISQFIDSLIFMLVAFYGASPRYTFAFILSLTIPYWLIKVLFAIIDTPFCYLLIRWVNGSARRSNKFETMEEIS